MQVKHWALIGGVCAAIGSMGASAYDWSEVFTPSFVFGALGAIGAVITALYTERPNERAQRRERIRRELNEPSLFTERLPSIDRNRPGFKPYGKTDR